MEQCIAIADYDAEGEDEISFKKGDTITVVAKGVNSGYWEGVVNTEPVTKASASTSNHSSGSGADGTSPTQNGKSALQGKRGLFPNCFVSSNLRPRLVPTFLDKAMALYDYKPRDENELALRKHDVITVVKPSASPGWWCGFNESALAREKQSGVDISSHKVTQLCGSSKKPLLFPTNFVTSKVVQATFSFQGRQSHELSFQAGDIILVHRRWNDGWWEGSIGTRRGIFPSNYTSANVATTSPPFFCMKCKTPYGLTALDCKECGKNDELVLSMMTALQDYSKGILPKMDLFAYVDLEPNRGGKSALLTVADTVDRSVRKERHFADA